MPQCLYHVTECLDSMHQVPWSYHIIPWLHASVPLPNHWVPWEHAPSTLIISYNTLTACINALTVSLHALITWLEVLTVPTRALTFPDTSNQSIWGNWRKLGINVERHAQQQQNWVSQIYGMTFELKKCSTWFSSKYQTGKWMTTQFDEKMASESTQRIRCYEVERGDGDNKWLKWGAAKVFPFHSLYTATDKLVTEV